MFACEIVTSAVANTCMHTCNACMYVCLSVCMGVYVCIIYGYISQPEANSEIDLEKNKVMQN